MSAPPYMKLFIADYLADTTHLTTAGHGAYLLLLMAMWRAGGKLPNNDTKLASIAQMSAAEWKKNRAIIMEFFKGSGGSLTHKRLRKELAHYEGVVERRKTARKATDLKSSNESSEIAHAFTATNSPKRVNNQNQNQRRRKGLKESPFPSSPQASAEARHEGASPPPCETVVARTADGAIDFAVMRERIAQESAVMAAKETA